MNILKTFYPPPLPKAKGEMAAEPKGPTTILQAAAVAAKTKQPMVGKRPKAPR